MRIGILGGTLDPVHFGHLEAAAAARRVLSLDEVRLIPSRLPPHRQTQPAASGYHRFAMAALAVNGLDWMAVSDMELQAPGPSYTSDTLSRLKAEGLDPSQLFFITGADAFAEIATWHEYPAVLEMAHFVVVSRPGYPAADLVATLPALAGRMRRGGPRVDADSEPCIHLVSERTPDISSSGIRRRLAEGVSIEGLVPVAVAAHIRRHGLYARPSTPAFHSAADHLHDEN
ncbi:MAG TPA: nicotinate-nucleotide adenylyltransferase [Vicinamibacterales bacterium]|nr:nicotinate-nucleotide adenylyltransferase [Vicinamibacterales bacterium]